MMLDPADCRITYWSLVPIAIGIGVWSFGPRRPMAGLDSISFSFLSAIIIENKKHGNHKW